jgi:spermidine/putrescine transport system ATP-binding protein
MSRRGIETPHSADRGAAGIAADTAAEAIRIENVVKTFGAGPHRVTALDGVSLSVRDNEFFTMLGPSGCGKTTLLRIIAGFEAASSGKIRLFGEEIENRPPHRRSINTVFQQYSLFPHMTVAENVAFGLRRLKWTAADIKARVQEMLALVKMETMSDRRPAQLSGGQQQRVALARALAPNPRVLLLDEPLSALDLKLRQAMRAELKQLQRKTGITFVFVTHDQDEALSMSDRIVVMSDGRIQQVGTPSEIYEYPANRLVADFIGDANFVEAEVVACEGKMLQCRVGAGDITLAVNKHSDHRLGEAVTLFLRPERIKLSAPVSDGLIGVVRTIMYSGGSAEYAVEIAPQFTLRAKVDTEEDGRPRFGPSDRVAVTFSMQAIRILG